MLDVIKDTLIDFLKLLPLLFLAYLVMELIEQKLGERSERMIKKAGKFGPLAGGLLGAVPQCGFSAAAAGLFSGGVITIGTLFSVFLSTSDEMLPIMLSHRADALLILKILGIKVLIGMIAGFAIDLIFKKAVRGRIEELCEQDNCGCEEKGVFRSALKHTVSVGAFILIVSFVLNTAIYFIGEETLSSLIIAKPVFGSLISAGVGLIPNCASSVIITELYLDGVMTPGALIGGLLSNAGVGLLVLFRANRRVKQNVNVVIGLYVIGAAVGVLFDVIGIAL